MVESEASSSSRVKVKHSSPDRTLHVTRQLNPMRCVILLHIDFHTPSSSPSLHVIQRNPTMPDNTKRPIRDALEPVTSALSSHGNTLSVVKEALWAPFHGEGLRGEGLRMITGCEFLFFFFGRWVLMMCGQWLRM